MLQIWVNNAQKVQPRYRHFISSFGESRTSQAREPAFFIPETLKNFAFFFKIFCRFAKNTYLSTTKTNKKR